MNNELVSIITPCYNSEKYLAETIESVLVQTYTNWEMLIVDDCSKDNSLGIAQNYKDKRIIVVKQEESGGAAKARNRAIEMSQGEYLAFLDSDDLWLPQKLEKQLRFMKENNCDFSFTEYEHIDENGKPLGKIAKVIKTLSYKKMFFHDFVGCLTVMYKQDQNNKCFGPLLESCNDYALFLRILKHVERAMGCNELLAKYRIVHNSLSRNKLKKFFNHIEMMTKYEGKNICVSLFYLMTNQLIKVFWKYKKKTEKL